MPGGPASGLDAAAQRSGLIGDRSNAVACASARLELRHMSVADAAFIRSLLNDPDYIRHIGDRGVRTQGAAARYIEEIALASYARYGFGLYRVVRRDDGAPLGMAGLVRREGFDAVEIGYALLPQYRGQGYAFEAARAALDLGRNRFGLARIVATCAPDNAESIKVLQRLGFEFERMVRLPGYTRDSCLYGPAERA